MKNSQELDNEEEEEEDYMSETFVDPSSLGQNSKPTSLLFSRKQKLELEKYKRKLASKPSSRRDQKEEEESRRQDALAKPIDQQNKGFLLLQKMMSKSASKPKDISELSHSNQCDLNEKTLGPPVDMEQMVRDKPPIPLSVKCGRQGLGHSIPNKRIKLSSNLLIDRTKKLETEFKLNEDQFRHHHRQKVTVIWEEKDFRKCQLACLNLDQQNGITEPTAESWYWPETQTYGDEDKSNLEEEPDDDTSKSSDIPELSLSDKLFSVNGYLRSKYQYCIWCGTRFDSSGDLGDNCPGDTRQAHDEEE